MVYGCERGAAEDWALEQQMALVLFGERRKHILSNSCAAKRYLRRQGFSAMWEMQLHCFWQKLLQTISEILVCVRERQNPAVPVLFCLLFRYVPALGVIFPLTNVTVFAQTLCPRMLIQPQQSHTSALALVVFP